MRNRRKRSAEQADRVLWIVGRGQSLSSGVAVARTEVRCVLDLGRIRGVQRRYSLGLQSEEVSMKRPVPQPPREPETGDREAPPEERPDPRNRRVPLYDEGGDEGDDSTPTRPLPVIPPAVGDERRDRRRAR